MTKITVLFILATGLILSVNGQNENKDTNPGRSDYLIIKELQDDFLQFRQIIEDEHCCTYEYASKAELDSMFDQHYSLIDSTMSEVEFFEILAKITARLGCMHTATWMPGRFFNPNANNMFPLKIKLIENYVVVEGTYNDEIEIPRGSILFEINGLPVWDIINGLREITSADARNPYFIDTQLTKRFSMFYASLYGFPEKHIVKYKLPGSDVVEMKVLTPATLESVRRYVFAGFNSPPLEFSILQDNDVAVLTIETFIYYDKVDYFTNFIDSCFSLIKEKGINNLVLDLRGNDGGDPFCAAPLLSYLQKSPVPYFAEQYGRYAGLAEPLPMPENHFTGNLYTLLDGRCGSTNGHFCALLKYNKIGKFVGTPGGSTYKCNAGRNTELRLTNSQMIITIGRSTYAAAVEGMDKRSPIYPDVPVQETYEDFLDGRDIFMETAIKQVLADKN